VRNKFLSRLQVPTKLKLNSHQWEPCFLIHDHSVDWRRLRQRPHRPHHLQPDRLRQGHAPIQLGHGQLPPEDGRQGARRRANWHRQGDFRLVGFKRGQSLIRGNYAAGNGRGTHFNEGIFPLITSSHTKYSLTFLCLKVTFIVGSTIKLYYKTLLLEEFVLLLPQPIAEIHKELQENRLQGTLVCRKVPYNQCFRLIKS